MSAHTVVQGILAQVDCFDAVVNATTVDVVAIRGESNRCLGAAKIERFRGNFLSFVPDFNETIIWGWANKSVFEIYRVYDRLMPSKLPQSFKCMQIPQENFSSLSSRVLSSTRYQIILIFAKLNFQNCVFMIWKLLAYRLWLITKLPYENLSIKSSWYHIFTILAKI